MWKVQNFMLQILSYIIKTNPWYAVPYRILLALLYQCYKRVIKGILIKDLFNGKKILLFPHNPICSAFMYTEIPDKNEIEALRALADSHTVFLDVGANVGAYSLLLADKLNNVYAFEAHPQTAQFCKMNFLLNDMNDAHVISALVGHNNAPKHFTNLTQGSPINTQAQQSENTICVNSVTLDEFVQQKNFDKHHNFIVKIDVEGFEHEVFEGAKWFLRTHPVKAIIFETFSERNSLIMDFLHECGYHTKQIGKHNMIALPSQARLLT